MAFQRSRVSIGIVATLVASAGVASLANGAPPVEEDRLAVAYSESPGEFGGDEGTPLEFSAPGALSVGVAVNLDVPDADSLDVSDYVAPMEEEAQLREVSDEELNAPLSDYELTIRADLGFPERSASELAKDPSSRDALAEFGFRMTASELGEMRYRDELAMIASNYVEEAAWPAGFGGFYFDTSSGQYVIQTTRDPEDARLHAEQFLPGDRVRVETVKRTHVELQQIASMIVPVGDDGFVDEARVASSLAGAYTDSISVAIHEAKNSVLVFATDDAPSSLLDEIRRFGGDAVRILSDAPREFEHCNQKNGCKPPLKSGMRIDVSATGLNGQCTLGGGYFKGSTVGYVSTAGHCSAPISSAQVIDAPYLDVLPGVGSNASTRARYGADTSAWSHNSNLDAQLNRFPILLINNRAWGYSTKLTGSFPLNGVIDGTTVRVSRGTTGGVVTNILFDYRTVGTRVVGQLQYDSAHGGDSGAPWFQGSRYAGHHVGDRNVQLEPGGTTAVRDYFEQVQLVENKWSVTYKGGNLRAERLTNANFASGTSSNPTGWNKLPGPSGSVAMGRVNDGHYNERSLNGWCTGGPNCSYYQDMNVSLSSSVKAGVGAWLYCQSTSPCTATVVLWGLGGSATPSNINRVVTVGALKAVYVGFEGKIPSGSHPAMRFQVYNNSSPGRVLWLSTPTVRR